MGLNGVAYSGITAPFLHHTGEDGFLGLQPGRITELAYNRAGGFAGLGDTRGEGGE